MLVLILNCTVGKRMHACIHALCMHVCMYVCMYVHMYSIV